MAQRSELHSLKVGQLRSGSNGERCSWYQERPSIQPPSPPPPRKKTHILYLNYNYHYWIKIFQIVRSHT